jgi:hypothetical protein
MPANLSTGKASALLTRVQLNPEIGVADPTYVADLIDRAAEDFVSSARLPRYPELSQGKSTSAASPGTDITALSTAALWVNVNGVGFQEITLTQTGNDTGAEIATELQTKIRANTAYGFDEVTVAYSSSLYVITSGRYGEGSSICIKFNEDKKHLCQSLKLSPVYGGVEVAGSATRDEADDLIVEMVEILYRKLGLEGTASGSVTGDNSYAMFGGELSPAAQRKLYSMRRLW